MVKISDNKDLDDLRTAAKALEQIDDFSGINVEMVGLSMGELEVGSGGRIHSALNIIRTKRGSLKNGVRQLYVNNYSV